MSDKEPEPRRFVLEKHLRYSELPQLTRHVWHVIASFGHAKTGDVLKYPPSHQQIAEAAGIKKRAVAYHIDRLVAEGWLLRDRGGVDQKTRYRLSCPWDQSDPIPNARTERTIPRQRQCPEYRDSGEPCGEWTVQYDDVCAVHQRKRFEQWEWEQRNRQESKGISKPAAEAWDDPWATPAKAD